MAIREKLLYGKSRCSTLYICPLGPPTDMKIICKSG